MLIQKFGGTSLGEPENFKKVSDIVFSDNNKKIIVLSALSDVTNQLIELSKAVKNKKNDLVFEIYEDIRYKFISFSNKLFNNPKQLYTSQRIIKEELSKLLKIIYKPFNKYTENEILSFGEIITCKIFNLNSKNYNKNTCIINATDFMIMDEDGNPDYNSIKNKLQNTLKQNSNCQFFITQGFICKDAKGKISNLQRGGSDKTATIIGSILKANEIQIWSDKDGMLNNDPRYVKSTYPLDYISYEEAEELAFNGAKILHPTCIKPAKRANVKVILKNTFNLKATGTLISNKTTNNNLKAVAAKDNVTVIKIQSSEMLMVYGFLKRIFEIFEFHKTSVDMITTSEISVSVTIDNDSCLKEIVHDLQKFSTVKIFKQQSMIAVVGNLPPSKQGLVYKIFNSIIEIPIRMISYGASSRSLSFIVDSKYKIQALNLLNTNLFNQNEFTKNRNSNTKFKNSGILV